jgi:hypothetical protein
MAKRKKSVTVADLKDDYGASRVFLYCDVCGEECSAFKGDYWDRSADKPFTCGHGAGDSEATFGEEPPVLMRLVRRETRLVGV